MRQSIGGRGLCAHLWLQPADQARKDVPCSPEAHTRYVACPGEGGAEGNPVPRVSRTTTEVMWGEAGLGALEGDAPSDLSVLGSESAFTKGCPPGDPRLVAPGRSWLRSGKVRQCPRHPGVPQVLGSQSGEPWEVHRLPSGSSALGQGRGPCPASTPLPLPVPTAQPQLPR